MNGILDTNVLVRFLVGDNEAQQRRAAQWLKEAAAGRRTVIVSTLVIAEACFVLESFYKRPRGEIADALEVFLAERWLRVEDREVLLGVWPWYRRGAHFVDSFLRAKAQVEGAEILTFDKGLGRQSKAPD
ncbi:MAG: PIN domain-containing protein [Patescibacteria group bacterium]